MNDRATSGDHEALPWLEAVDDEDQPRGMSARKMLAALVMVAIAVAIIAGTTCLVSPATAGKRDDSIRHAVSALAVDP